MKYSVHWSLVLTVLFSLQLISCESESGWNEPTICGSKSLVPCSDGHISQSEALDIASRLLKQTRSDYSLPEIVVVQGNGNTRSGESSDAVAYVINYPEGGFAVISGSRNVHPVLAYSETGSFSLDNEIVKENFMDRISDYIASSEGETVYDTEELNFEPDVLIPPRIQFVISQDDPWNKYAPIMGGKHCKAGCVAVASALIMLHTKEKLEYKGRTFEFSKILKGLRGENNVVNPQGFSPGFNPTPIDLPYTYDRAVDSVARLLRFIGYDVGIKYGDQNSVADSKNALTLFASLNYSIPSTFLDLNLSAMAQYIKDGNILYMKGLSFEHGGHAWVVDGCRYKMTDFNDGLMKNIYLYCDWGRDGACNGYYTSSVFELESGERYANMQYFPVKKEIELPIIQNEQ